MLQLKWLISGVLDLNSRGFWSEPHQTHCDIEMCPVARHFISSLLSTGYTPCKLCLWLYPPQTLFVVGILFSRPCVRPSVRNVLLSPTKLEGYSFGVVRPFRPSVRTFCLSGTISQYLLVRFNSFLVQMISTMDS